MMVGGRKWNVGFRMRIGESRRSRQEGAWQRPTCCSQRSTHFGAKAVILDATILFSF